MTLPKTPLTPRSPRQARGGKLGRYVLSELKAAKRQDALRRQSEDTRRLADGWIIRPAIGRTGGADNRGWELLEPISEGSYRERYLATAEQAHTRHRELTARA